MYGKSNCDRQPEITLCEIQVEGQLSHEWSAWFEGIDIQQGSDPGNEMPVTILSGPITDQAELHGILAKIRDLNLKLISVRITGRQANP